MSGLQSWGLPLLVATVPAAISYLASRAASRRGQRQRELRADGEAYDRAQRINQQVIDQLQGEIDRLRVQLAELRVSLQASNAANAELERKVVNLERTVHRMRVLLEQNEIPIPETL